MSYQSFNEIINICQRDKKEFWQVILEEDMFERGVTREESFQKMRDTWDAMLFSAHRRGMAHLFEIEVMLLP